MNEELSNYQIYSEPFPEMGSISGEGATKLLGQALTPLELLLRKPFKIAGMPLRKNHPKHVLRLN